MTRCKMINDSGNVAACGSHLSFIIRAFTHCQLNCRMVHLRLSTSHADCLRPRQARPRLASWPANWEPGGRLSSAIRASLPPATRRGVSTSLRKSRHRDPPVSTAWPRIPPPITSRPAWQPPGATSRSCSSAWAAAARWTAPRESISSIPAAAGCRTIGAPARPRARCSP